MKVLLVQSYLGKDIPLVFPLGLAYIAGCLEGHEVQMLDLNLYEDPHREPEKAIRGFGPDIVGVSLRNIDNQNRLCLRYFYKECQATIKRIKQIVPGTPLVCGGAGFSMFALGIMERNAEIDFGILHEGEEIFRELLDNLDKPQKVKGLFFRNNGEIAFTGERRPPDVKKLPFPRRDLLDLSKYPVASFALGVQAKRGCFLNCTYCSYPFLSGNTVRLREPDNVVDEIQEMVEKYRVDSFMFSDSVFNVPLEQARQICQEIIRRGLEVKWAAYYDIRFADEEFLVLAKQAGCQDFVFSPDAVSKGALMGLNKGISKTDIDCTIALFRQNNDLKNCHAIFGFFLNALGETFFGLVQTVLFYVKTRLSLRRSRTGVSLSWIRVEPDTGVYRIAVQQGLLQPDTELLPEKVRGLKRLFYCPPQLYHVDLLFFSLLKIVRGLKTVAKAVLRFFAKWIRIRTEASNGKARTEAIGESNRSQKTV